MGSNVKFESPIKFETDEVFTYGVSSNKYGGFNLPVKFDAQCPQIALLKSIASENGATVKFYGEDSSTIYFQLDQLSEKQNIDLFGKGLMIVKIAFETTGTYKRKDGTIGLRLRLTKLSKVRVAERTKAPPPSD